MNNAYRFASILTNRATTAVTRMVLGLTLAAGMATSLHAQGQAASGTIIGSGSGPSYSYSLSFSDAPTATAPIGTVWYAWIPFAFNLPGTPTSASAPAGWTATVDGNSVVYSPTSAANDIQPGQTLSGFGYQATFSPATLASTPNSEQSDAYSKIGTFSGADDVFTVQAVPEPSTLALLIPGAIALGRIVRRKLRAA
ncbi:MAG TPA: PEP-CTERM sorting domain-containing protein [Candidatus Binatia bacterium]|nr:PEP-CTERM sorting domain-containing protein [Candidatus Binatia bacterium]